MGRQTKSGWERRAVAPGTAPGTLNIDPAAPRPVLRAFAFGPDGFTEEDIGEPTELEPLLESWPVVWINVDGWGDEAVLRRLAEMFHLHRLVLEDVVSANQRPKVEAYDEHLFVVLQMPRADDAEVTEQLSIFVGPGFVLSFQERQGDWFDPIRERIRHGRGLVRRAGSDYLAYTLIDAVIDADFPIVEQLGDELEVLDEEVLGSPETETVAKLHALKRRLIGLRRAVGPHREAINALLRDSSQFITPETAVYLRDCYDHLLRLTERVEIHREQCSDLMGTYLSIVSNRMNDVMRVLTVIASIFIPLTFLAGIYGMNFNPEAGPLNMPELNWRWGYPVFWGVIVAMAVGLLAYFKRKRWL